MTLLNNHSIHNTHSLLQETEQKAWDALANQDYFTFAKYTAQWQAYNNTLVQPQEDPFITTALMARTQVLGRKYVDQWHCRECGARLQEDLCHLCGTTRPASLRKQTHHDCHNCNAKGSVTKGVTTLAIAHGPNRRLITNIPALVCSLCQDATLSNYVTQAIEHTLDDQTPPTGLTMLPWYDLEAVIGNDHEAKQPTDELLYGKMPTGR